ncbi:MAG: hypothetical protein WCS87_08915 [Methylococcaceae bacterium]
MMSLYQKFKNIDSTSQNNHVRVEEKVSSLFIVGLFYLLLVCSGCSKPVFAEWSYLDSWKAYPEFKGQVPKRSDVIFSTRSKRDEAPEIARAYGATRIEWVYSTDTQFISRLHAVTPWFGGTINATIALKDDKGIAIGLEGKPIVAPWMKSWGAKWISVADPQTRVALTNLATHYIKSGASSIQIDDPLLQFGARRWGADFSEASIKGFREFLLKYPDKQGIKIAGLDKADLDYRLFLRDQFAINTTEDYLKRQKVLPSTPIWHAYLKASVLSHYVAFRTALDSVAGKQFPLSMNFLLFGPDEKSEQFALVPFVDYAMVETKINDYDVLTLQAATYRALGIGYAPSIQPMGMEENRAAIASLYALGGQPIVPWDVYINQGPESKPSRFFGTPKDYSDLYQFVRHNADTFDGFEGLPVVGILAPVSHYNLKNTLALVRRLNQAGVPFALVPVGGSYSIDNSKLSHFRLLVTVNPLADIGQDNVSAIKKNGVELISSELINGDLLRKLSPFNELPIESTRVVIRGNTLGHTSLAVHVIPLPNSNSKNRTGNCEQNISIKNSFIENRRVLDASFYAGKGSVPMLTKQDEKALSMKNLSCDAWGVALVRLSEKIKE